MIGRALAIALAFPSASFATTGGDASPQRPFTVVCTLTDTCYVTGGCASLPVPGEVMVQFDGTTTAMGPRADALRPLDHFARLEDIPSLPRSLPHSLPGRRDVLVDLPAEDADRRFALFAPSPIAGGEAAGQLSAPVLQPTYFILACRNAGP